MADLWKYLLLQPTELDQQRMKQAELDHGTSQLVVAPCKRFLFIAIRCDIRLSTSAKP